MPGATPPSVLAGASPTCAFSRSWRSWRIRGLLLALLLLGGVVAAVLAQVALLAGLLDLAGDLGAAPTGEILELRLEPVVRLLGQPGDTAGLGHGGLRSGACRPACAGHERSSDSTNRQRAMQSRTTPPVAEAGPDGHRRRGRTGARRRDADVRPADHGPRGVGGADRADGRPAARDGDVERHPHRVGSEASTVTCPTETDARVRPATAQTAQARAAAATRARTATRTVRRRPGGRRPYRSSSRSALLILAPPCRPGPLSG